MTHARILSPDVRKKRVLLSAALVMLLALLLLPTSSYALVDEIAAWIAGGFGTLLEMTADFLGTMTVQIVHVLVNWIAPYNNFVGFEPSATGEAHPVEVGWTVVRDFANMFFIVVLLVVAFATMLRAEKYNYRALLPRLLVMAVVINFSRTIVAFIIDISQVAMLTFVNAFQEAAGGNFILGLGIQNLFSVPQGAGIVDGFKAVVSFMLVNVFLAIALMTILIITLTLTYRIVMLWMITILSPAAFLLSTFPRGAKYYGEWWDQLICWAVSGPVLAFFLWLALATMAAGGGDVAAQATGSVAEGRGVQGAFYATEAAKEANIVRFIIGIMMLLFGVQTSQQFCGVGVGMAQAAGSFLKQKGVAAAKATAMFAGGAAVGAATASFKTFDYKTKFRQRAYGALGRFAPTQGIRDFAGRRLAGVQEAATKRHEESEKAAAVLADSDPNRLVGMAKRGTVGSFVADAGADSSHAGYLHKSVTSGKVFNERVKYHGGGEEGRQKATDEREELMEQYEEVAKRSSNPSVVAKFEEAQKTLPHLIKDEKKRKEVVAGMSTGDLLKMAAEALGDAVVYSSISTQGRKHLGERGSADQRAGIMKARAQEAGVENLNPGAQTTSYLATDTGKQNASMFFDSLLAIAADAKRKPKDQKYSPTDHTRAQTVATQIAASGKLDPKLMRSSQLLEHDGDVAAAIAGSGHPDLIKEIATNDDHRELAQALSAGIANFRAENPAIAGTPADDKLADTMFEAGAGREESFKPGQLEAALGNPARSEVVIKGMTANKLKKDQQLRITVAEEIKLPDVRRAARSGDAKQQLNAKAIARAVVAEDEQNENDVKVGKHGVVRNALLKAKANDIRTDSTLKKLLKSEL